MPPSVLIVDDHPSFRLSARRMLEAYGYTVVGEAEDGERALAAARRLGPDLVLLDIQLPGIDGFEVALRLATAERHRRSSSPRPARAPTSAPRSLPARPVASSPRAS